MKNRFLETSVMVLLGATNCMLRLHAYFGNISTFLNDIINRDERTTKAFES